MFCHALIPAPAPLCRQILGRSPDGQGTPQAEAAAALIQLSPGGKYLLDQGYQGLVKLKLQRVSRLQFELN